MNRKRDEFEDLAKSGRQPEAPPELLERCLATVPAEGVADEAAAWLQGQPAVNGHASWGRNGEATDHPTTLRSSRKNVTRYWVTAISAAASIALAVGTLAYVLSEDPGPVPGGNNVAHNEPSPEKPGQSPQDQPGRQPETAPQPEEAVVEKDPQNNPAPTQQPNLPPEVGPQQQLAGEALLEAHLEAGEYAAALNMAQQVQRIETRDEWLARIAKAQAQSSDPSVFLGSFETLAQIYDDRTRTGAINGIAGLPVGQRGAGGGPQPDFDSLLELVKSTVAPQSWDDVGGPGSAQPFPTGIYVDAQGELHRKLKKDNRGWLTEMWLNEQKERGSVYADARSQSHLRKISLTRLEKYVQLRQAFGLPIEEPMQYLAGLQKIEYVMVYPETGDIVIAGPAGGWMTNTDGRVVSTETGRPVLRLEDLIVMLRYFQRTNDYFGCMIVPRKENLAKLAASPPMLEGHKVKKWVEEIRSTLGKQDIAFFQGGNQPVRNFDPRTRAARVLVEADYHMKLVGIGLADGTDKCPSYLEMLDKPPASMEVLRWWFSMAYQDILTNDEQNIFAVRGQGVKVRSENEHVTETGQRIHTGKSTPQNAAFAHNFTNEFSALAKKYPIYADLQNVFDLALVASLIQNNGLADRVSWHQTYFGEDGAYVIPLGPQPAEVESVINYRVFDNGKTKTYTAQASGGVRIDPSQYVQANRWQTDRSGQINSARDRSVPRELPLKAWWWD